MNGRALGIGLGVGLGVIAVGVGGYFGLKKLLHRPPHQVVITYRRHGSASANDTQLATVAARELATRAAHLERVRSVSTPERVTLDCSFGSKPLQYDEDDKAIADTNAQVLRSLPTLAPPVVEEAPPDSTMWVLSTKDIYGQLDAIRGVQVWRGCGTPPPKQLYVQLDPAKLNAYKVDLADFVLEMEHQVSEGALPLEKIKTLPVKGYVTLDKVATAIGNYVHLSTCTTLVPASDGTPVIALRMKLHPKIAPEDRGKVDAIVKESSATLLGEKDFREVRFFPASQSTYEQAVALAFKMVQAEGAPVIAAMMTNERVGTLLVKKEAKDADIRDFVKRTPDAAWGGIRGRRYVQVTVTNKDRNAAYSQAQQLIQKISRVEGIGEQLLTEPPNRPEVTYDIDEVRALVDGIDLGLIRALIPSLAEQDATLPIVFLGPFDGLSVRGNPMSKYVTMRTTMDQSRLLRIDAEPAVELRWDLPDSKPLKRVRQIVGESPAVTVEDVSAR